MKAISRAEAPVAIEGDGVELRMQKLGGGMTTAFVRVPKGADFRPALAGLPDDLCQCPHWGYLLNGRVKMHTRDGEESTRPARPSTGRPDTRPRRSRTPSMWSSPPLMSSTMSSTTSRRRDDRPAGRSLATIRNVPGTTRRQARSSRWQQTIERSRS